MIIDVSKWQGAIDWPAVGGEGGVTCAIMRCTLGATGTDIQYARNWSESARAGIPRRGAYHYVITNVSASLQLGNILAVTGGDFGNEPFTVDVERTSAERVAMAGGWPFPKAAYTNMLLELTSRLAQRARVRIYTNKTEWQAMTTQPAWAANYGLHVAGYPADPNNTVYRPFVPAPWVDWTMWQFSSTGRVAGIASNVDLNRDRVVEPVVVPPSPPPPVDTGAIAQVIRLIDEAGAGLKGLVS